MAYELNHNYLECNECSCWIPFVNGLHLSAVDWSSLNAHRIFRRRCGRLCPGFEATVMMKRRLIRSLKHIKVLFTRISVQGYWFQCIYNVLISQNVRKKHKTEAKTNNIYLIGNCYCVYTIKLRLELKKGIVWQNIVLKMSASRHIVGLKHSSVISGIFCLANLYLNFFSHLSFEPWCYKYYRDWREITIKTFTLTEGIFKLPYRWQYWTTISDEYIPMKKKTFDFNYEPQWESTKA